MTEQEEGDALFLAVCDNVDIEGTKCNNPALFAAFTDWLLEHLPPPGTYIILQVPLYDDEDNVLPGWSFMFTLLNHTDPNGVTGCIYGLRNQCSIVLPNLGTSSRFQSWLCSEIGFDYYLRTKRYLNIRGA